jgi:hypothetical protein
MSKLCGLTLVAALVFAARAEKPEPEPKDPAPPKADVRGTARDVVAIKLGSIVRQLSVDGKKEKDTQHDRARVFVPKRARIYLWKGGKKVEAKLTDVVDGCVVQCVFAGLMDTSLPVGAIASEVLILSVPKKK